MSTSRVTFTLTTSRKFSVLFPRLVDGRLSARWGANHGLEYRLVVKSVLRNIFFFKSTFSGIS